LRPDVKGKSIGSAQLTFSGKRPIQLKSQDITLMEVFPVDEKTNAKVSAQGAK
jgi:hypothetical protein